MNRFTGRRDPELAESLRELSASERLTSLAMIAGLALMVGALAALLFAPQTRPARQKIGETVERGVSAGKEKASDLAGGLAEKFPQIKAIMPHKANGHSKHQIPD